MKAWECSLKVKVQFIFEGTTAVGGKLLIGDEGDN